MANNKDNARNATDAELEKMERKLRKIYSTAVEELTQKVEDFYAAFEVKDKIMRQKLKKGEITPAYYKRWKSGQMFIGKRWEDMKKQATLTLSNADKIATDYINGRLPDIYSTVYNIRADEIHAEVPQVSFTLSRPRAVKTMIMANGRSFLPYKKLGPDEQRWNMKRINSQLLQGMLQGEDMKQMAKRIVKLCSGNEAAAMRTARTVVNATENMARHESALEAQKMGCIQVHMWSSSGDARVRDWHVEADNDYGTLSQAIPLDEPFIVMGEQMRYPCDRWGSPENVYNCRCQELTKIVGFKSILPKDKQGKIRIKGEQ